jgi:hypothetical protein
MPQERHEYLKAIIQEALWNTFKQTNEPIYQEVYVKWYERFSKIDITNLE